MIQSPHFSNSQFTFAICPWYKFTSPRLNKIYNTIFIGNLEPYSQLFTLIPLLFTTIPSLKSSYRPFYKHFVAISIMILHSRNNFGIYISGTWVNKSLKLILTIIYETNDEQIRTVMLDRYIGISVYYTIILLIIVPHCNVTYFLLKYRWRGYLYISITNQYHSFTSACI